MSAGHSRVPASYSIHSTWHPASLGWVPRKWRHQSSWVTPSRAPVGSALKKSPAPERQVGGALERMQSLALRDTAGQVFAFVNPDQLACRSAIGRLRRFHLCNFEDRKPRSFQSPTERSRSIRLFRT